MRTGQTTNGHQRGDLIAADPDARCTRATHSLAGKHGCAAPKLNGHCPRRSNLLSSTLAVTRRKNLRLSRLGRHLERSPRLSTAQAMRAFLAAMAITARQ